MNARKLEAAISSKIILEAIALRKCLAATYNRTSFLLAPQILYTKHGEPYVDAVALAKDGRRPRETRLASFKLSGLGEVTFARETFDADPAFDPADPRYADSTLFSLAM